MTNKPNVQYTWDEKASFVLNGREFEFLFNGIKVLVETPEVQKALLLNRSLETLSKVLSRGIESGIVNVKEDTPPDSSLLQALPEKPAEPVNDAGPLAD